MLAETIACGSKSLLYLEIDENHDNNDLTWLPGWFTGDTFPSLRMLKFDPPYCPWVQPGITSISTLTELDLRASRCWRANIVSVMDQSVFQMRCLRTLRMTYCDFSALPPMILPSLKELYICHCTRLYELCEFDPDAQHKLELIHLNGLFNISVLPESMCVLTALQTLCIEALLISIPTSMRALAGLRELTIYAPSENIDDTHMLLTEIAFCLPWWCHLRKLCMIGSGYRTTIQEENDTVAIGLALRAWPLPWLDIMDMRFLDDFFSNINGHEPSRAATLPLEIFNFKLHWRPLGLPAEAEGWDDGVIMEHWRMQMSKTHAFVMATHRSLGQDSAFAGLSESLMAAVANALGGSHDLSDADRARAPQRIIQHREECERKKERMAREEKAVILDEEKQREETAAFGPPELERLYEQGLARAREQQHLKFFARISELISEM